MFAAIIKAFPGMQAGDNIKKFCKYMGYKISWSIRGILQKNAPIAVFASQKPGTGYSPFLNSYL